LLALQTVSNTAIFIDLAKVQAERIDQNWFLSLDDARSEYEAYRRENNGERPHSAIGNKTAMAARKAMGHTSRPMVWATEDAPRAGPTLGARSASSSLLSITGRRKLSARNTTMWTTRRVRK